MKDMKGICDCFYGSVTVGERGQIVIPAEARSELGIKPGDKLLMMRHPIHHGMLIVNFESVIEFIEEFQGSLKKIQNKESSK